MSRAARVWTGVAIVAIAVVVAGVVVSRPGFDAPFTDVVDEWAVGMAVGPGPVDLTLAPEDPVITSADVADDGGVGVADPFLVRTNDGWLMFYEVIRLDERGPNGERAVIGVASSDDGIDWQHRGIVLEEPFHLSYPGVFEDGGSWYMVPESGEAGRVILYEATAFPMQWTESKTLLEGVYRDPTVFSHGGTWWMYATDSGEVDDDTLRLFMAPELYGPWTEHPASPVVDGDVSRSRSGGGVVFVDGELIRFAQDNTDGYGKAVEAHVITTLTTTDYAEEQLVGGPVVAATGSEWTASGMHHVSAVETVEGRWRVAIDGYATHRVFGIGR